MQIAAVLSFDKFMKQKKTKKCSKKRREVERNATSKKYDDDACAALSHNVFRYMQADSNVSSSGRQRIQNVCVYCAKQLSVYNHIS